MTDEIVNTEHEPDNKPLVQNEGLITGDTEKPKQDAEAMKGKEVLSEDGAPAVVIHPDAPAKGTTKGVLKGEAAQAVRDAAENKNPEVPEPPTLEEIAKRDAEVLAEQERKAKENL